MALLLPAAHKGGIDVIKAELTLFKQKMLITGKLGIYVDVSVRDVLVWN